jgi:hypothetical protein
MKRFTTRIDANWQVCWWHKWGRADFLAGFFVFFGFFNAARSVVHHHYGGLGWLFSALVGTILFTASGLEPSAQDDAGMVPGVDSERPRGGLASRTFSCVIDFGSRLDARLAGRPEERDDRSR